MSYFESIFVKEFLDSPNIDPFGRLRVSTPYVMFDSKQNGGNPLRHLSFVSKSLSGGTFVSGAYAPVSTIAVTSTSGSRVIMQSRRRMNYFPGRGLVIKETFVLGTGSQGVIKRVGYFDEENGIFLEQSGSDINLVLRSKTGPTVTENRVSQSNWNMDPFDGTTNSHQPEALDFSKAQIFEIDLQWLGVGRVRTYFVNSSGSIVPVHDFRHANHVDTVYMSNPNLPIRAEVENMSGLTSNSMDVICASVAADGAARPLGIYRSVDTGTGSLSIAAGVRRAIASIKLKSGSVGRNVVPQSINILATSNVDYKWEMIHNPTFTTDNATWTPLVNSAIEYDISRTNAVISGTVLISGYGSSTNQASFNIVQQVASSLVLGTDVDGVSDNFALVVTPTTTGTFLASLMFEEYD